MSDRDLLTGDDGPARDSFAIDSMERADWAVRIIAKNRARVADLTTLASSLKAGIDERLSILVSPHVEDIANV